MSPAEIVRTGEASLGTLAPAEREALGRQVRLEWIAWAQEQSNPKPSWLVPWEELSEPEREVDRRIGVRLYELGVRVTMTIATEMMAEEEG